MNASRQLLRMVLATFAFLVGGAGCGTAAAVTVGTGFVEEARYLADARQLVVSGWAAPEKASVFTTNLIVSLEGEEIYRGRLERSERADVVQSTGRADWLWSGFSARIALPTGTREAVGPQAIAARMRLGDGTEFELEVAPQARSIEVAAATPAPALWTRIALLLAMAAPLAALFGMPRAARWARPIAGISWGERSLFGAAVVLSFLLLVAAGWTGSSLGILLDQSGVARHDEKAWLGELRRVRSDEWQVVSPLAISQAAHEPAFPVINRNLGPDGQNMLVIGMTGMPVAHVSAIAKPATWGFFVFDLRRALAWYWWLPFFACFGALWMFLHRFFAVDWRLAAGLALTMAAAPYSVVFSGWPAYTAFFPVAGMLAADGALRSRTWQHGAGMGALLGLAIAGFVLVLYPAWQISLAYLFIPFALAWVTGKRKEFVFGAPQAVALALALLVAGVLLGAWWLDARDAVASIRGTVYPGQRSVETGGDIDRWFLIKGLMSPMTMYRDSSLMWGASDAGSIVLFVLPAFAAVGARLLAIRRIDAVAAVLCAYVATALWFMFIGFWPELARWSLWGSSTSYRLDLALGLAQVMLFAWLAAPRNNGAAPERDRPKLAIVVAALVAQHGAWLYQRVQPAIIENVPASFVVLSVLALGVGSYLLVRGRDVAFLAVYGALMLAAAAPFNPLGLATHAVAPGPALAQAVRSAEGSGTGGKSRHGVVVVGERNWSMVLPAAGLPVVNSVFYHPPETLWRGLDPEGKFRVVYNRYQRVLFTLAPLDSPAAYRIDAPRIDEVRVTVDPSRFDFRLTGGSSVLAGTADARPLARNASLEPLHVDAQWTLFAVRP
ncbi:MAG: hypothetical protein ABIU58_01280 [Ramlibacter sp.]